MVSMSKQKQAFGLIGWLFIAWHSGPLAFAGIILLWALIVATLWQLNPQILG